MAELRLPPVPADLKHLLPFVSRAQEMRSKDPVICYWTLYHVARLGIQGRKVAESRTFLSAVLDQLEDMKRSLNTQPQIIDEAAASSYIRQFSLKIFNFADNEDTRGQATRTTAKKFLAASHFLEILRTFGPLDGKVEDMIKYAKYRAAVIARAMREGTTPTPGIPGSGAPGPSNTPRMPNTPAPSPHHGSPEPHQHPLERPPLVSSPAQNQMSSPRHMDSNSSAPGQELHQSNAPTPVPLRNPTLRHQPSRSEDLPKLELGPAPAPEVVMQKRPASALMFESQPSGSSRRSQLPPPTESDSTRPAKKRKKRRKEVVAAVAARRNPRAVPPNSRAAGKQPVRFSTAPTRLLFGQPAPPKPQVFQPSPPSSGWKVGEIANQTMDWSPEAEIAQEQEPRGEELGKKHEGVESRYELPSDSTLAVPAGDDAGLARQAGASIQTGLPYDSPNLRFYSANNPLRVARFENDPELLDNIQDLGVPVLENVVWQPNGDEMLQGGFGYVERAAWNNQDVAVKFLKGSQTVTGKARGKRSFRRELIAWSRLTHPNILPFLGVVCVENMFLGMVSPYMQNGCAPMYVAKNPGVNVLQILYDVAVGMSHLAAQKPPIAHGDLKGANVLIDQDGRARICDFGLSQLMKDFQSIDTTFGGTIRWMAPEQLSSETIAVSLSADIYSWGMLALELMTGKIPWSEVEQDYAVVIMVCARDERPGRPTCETKKCQAQPECTCLTGDDALWALIRRCWLLDPHERPTVAQVCEELGLNSSPLSHMDTSTDS